MGRSRLGKTEWARSLGRHMYFNGMLNLDSWDDDAKYIILDDFNCDIGKYLPMWKSFFGAQREFTLTDKYRKKRTVRFGKPLLWLCNCLPQLSERNDQLWLEANSKSIQLTYPLFNIE